MRVGEVCPVCADDEHHLMIENIILRKQNKLAVSTLEYLVTDVTIDYIGNISGVLESITKLDDPETEEEE